MERLKEFKNKERIEEIFGSCSHMEMATKYVNALDSNAIGIGRVSLISKLAHSLLYVIENELPEGSSFSKKYGDFFRNISVQVVNNSVNDPLLQNFNTVETKITINQLENITYIIEANAFGREKTFYYMYIFECIYISLKKIYEELKIVIG